MFLCSRFLNAFDMGTFSEIQMDSLLMVNNWQLLIGDKLPVPGSYLCLAFDLQSHH